MMRPNALGGNDRIGLMEPFAFPTDEDTGVPTVGLTDGHALKEVGGRI